jgi:tRNA U34 5-carboxymethylaminomethyl modifying GTPase MnmE/TrmE
MPCRTDGCIRIGYEEDGKLVAGLDACVTAFKILYVSTVFVDEAYRRKGIGAKLIREMEKRVQITDTIQDRMTHQRHIALAKRALASLAHAIDGIDAGFELDLAEIDLKEALEALSEITGEDASEEVIDRVFKNFCVGK